MKTFKYITILIISVVLAGNLNGQVSTQTVTALSPAVQVLLGRLFSSNERERINAALKLANYRHPRVVEGLIVAIEKDSSEMVKRVVLRSLGQIGNFEALPVILSSISSDSRGIKVEAMRSAINFSTPSVSRAIIKQVDSPNPLIRQKAITYLGRIKPNNSGIVEIIIERLQDISEGVRVAACQVLAYKRVIRAVNQLSGILYEDKSEVVRRYAAEALGMINGIQAKDILKKALDDSSPLVRITVSRSLAIIGSKRGMVEAIEAIKSPDARIRVMACETLGIVGEESTKILLKQAQQDIDRRVQKAAESALKKMAQRLDKIKNNN